MVLRTSCQLSAHTASRLRAYTPAWRGSSSQLRHSSPLPRPRGDSRTATRAASPSVTTAPPMPATPAAPPSSTPSPQELKRVWEEYIVAFQQSQYNEHSFWIDETMVEGTIPSDLKGTLLRNGPGLFEVAGRKIPQPFDGDGMVVSFAFEDGKVFYRNRFVRTEGFVKEQRAGKQLYRSAFNKGVPEGSLFNNPLNFGGIKNVANTNIAHWAGKTLALYETGLPYAITPDLRTLGEDDLGGIVGGGLLAAHGHVVVEADGSRRYVTFGAQAGGGSDSRVFTYEFNEQGRCVAKREDVLKDAAFAFLHDMAVTENYYVFMQNPIRIDLWTMLTQHTVGKESIAGCLKFDSQLPVKVWLIPRPKPGQGPAGPPKVFPLAVTPFFSFHHANAYEAEGGRMLVLDTFAADHINFSLDSDGVKPEQYESNRMRNTMSRVVLDLQTGEAQRHKFNNRTAEMPAVSEAAFGRPHNVTYSLASVVNDPTFTGPLVALSKVTCSPLLGVSRPFSQAEVQQQVWWGGPATVCQEPVVVPRAGARSEDDAWVMSLMLDLTSMRTSLNIFDGLDISKGPVGRIHLGHHLPMGLHGSWTPQQMAPPAGTPNSASYNIKNGV